MKCYLYTTKGSLKSSLKKITKIIITISKDKNLLKQKQYYDKIHL